MVARHFGVGKGNLEVLTFLYTHFYSQSCLFQLCSIRTAFQDTWCPHVLSASLPLQIPFAGTWVGAFPTLPCQSTLLHQWFSSSPKFVEVFYLLFPLLLFLYDIFQNIFYYYFSMVWGAKGGEMWLVCHF